MILLLISEKIMQKNVQPATYYYANLIGSDYSFAYSLSDTDMVRNKSIKDTIIKKIRLYGVYF